MLPYSIYFPYWNVSLQHVLYSNSFSSSPIAFSNLLLHQTQDVKIQSIESKQVAQTKECPKINKRNILPNITRKIVSFILDQSKSKSLIEFKFPEMDDLDFIRFYEYVARLRSKFTPYISKDHFRQLTFGDNTQEKSKPKDFQQYHRIIRILSKYFLDRYAISWILSSKKMKKELKIQHVKYCRKMKSLLSCKDQLH